MESAIHGEVKTLAAGKSPFTGLNTPMKKAVRTSWTHKKTELQSLQKESRIFLTLCFH